MSAKSVLVIEDDRDTRTFYRQALEMEDYEVAVVGSGAEAIDHLKSQAIPRLILLDLTLPDMSGADFLKVLRENPEWMSIKVVIVSGWDRLKTRAKEAGADGFIMKPCELDTLLREVAKHLS